MKTMGDRPMYITTERRQLFKPIFSFWILSFLVFLIPTVFGFWYLVFPVMVILGIPAFLYHRAWEHFGYAPSVYIFMNVFALLLLYGLAFALRPLLTMLLL